jgi:hypothetical protein
MFSDTLQGYARIFYVQITFSCLLLFSFEIIPKKLKGVKRTCRMEKWGLNSFNYFHLYTCIHIIQATEEEKGKQNQLRLAAKWKLSTNWTTIANAFLLYSNLFIHLYGFYLDLTINALVELKLKIYVNKKFQILFFLRVRFRHSNCIIFKIFDECLSLVIGNRIC